MILLTHEKPIGLMHWLRMHPGWWVISEPWLPQNKKNRSIYGGFREEKMHKPRTVNFEWLTGRETLIEKSFASKCHFIIFFFHHGCCHCLTVCLNLTVLFSFLLDFLLCLYLYQDEKEYHVPIQQQAMKAFCEVYSGDPDILYRLSPSLHDNRVRKHPLI